jgi:molybdopterin synthase sulfur carrier subunit
LARIVLTGLPGVALPGGGEELQIDAGNIFQLVAALDRISPGFADVAEARVAFAVDGVLTTDWATPFAADAEVLVVPRLAGG